MRQRPGHWLVVATVATVATVVAGCADPASNRPPATGRTDVWFMQHMVPHLRQTTAVVDLARDRITRPAVARLAETIDRQGRARLQQLQGWLDRRGLPPHVHSHQPSRRETDLVRLSRVRGAGFDLAFLQVMTARHRAGSRLAAAEARDGSVPEVRQLARRMLAEQRAQIEQMNAWHKAWSKPAAGRVTRSSRPGPAPAARCRRAC